MIAIALGGAFGAEFPYGTLIVNVLGSLCLGFAFRYRPLI